MIPRVVVVNEKSPKKDILLGANEVTDDFVKRWL